MVHGGKIKLISVAKAGGSSITGTLYIVEDLGSELERQTYFIYH
jgi:hypothetical protein